MGCCNRGNGIFKSLHISKYGNGEIVCDATIGFYMTATREQ